jgi:hypothetical protein
VGEIIGPASSGRTSLALSILATASRAGEFAAVVDPCDVFDPPSAEAAGVDLSRILWVRATERRAWLRSTEQLLEASGFSLVVLDVAGSSLGGFPLSVWPRLTRAAAASQTSLIVLGSERVAGTFSALTLELDPARPCFSGAPLLFEGLQGQLHLVRNRTGPSNRFPLWVRLRAQPAATTASLGSARSASPTSAGSLSLAASLRAPIGACGPGTVSGQSLSRPRRGA